MKKKSSLRKFALLGVLSLIALTGIAYSTSGSVSAPEEKCLKMRLFYRVTTHPDGTYDAVLDSMCSISAKGDEITALQL